MTEQQIFDKVVSGLRAQGCKSENAEATCMYRGPNETKCAAGLLLPDDKYNPSMEGLSVSCAEIRHVFIDIVGEDNIDLLESLQNIHDAYPIDQWESRWKQVAFNYSLQYTPPTLAKAN